MIRLLSGDCRDVLPTLPAESVQCVVTSPPYYALRSYLDAAHPDKHREIGSEATPDEYLATMVGVFREVRRVLRRDGTCWVNMGDSYNNRTKVRTSSHQPALNNFVDDNWAERAARGGVRMSINDGTIKEKDLLLMPARLALALQADGWWVRSDIIWHKPNPMPESCTDRPTSAHEHVFLLTKSGTPTGWTHRDGLPGMTNLPPPDYRWVHKATREERDTDPGDPETWRRINLWRGHDYYYDADAVREEAEYGASIDRDGAACGPFRSAAMGGAFRGDTRAHSYGGSRNLRNVWTIATHAYSAAHFATFPPELAERCIKAGTSERGCCAACGKPWVRQMQRALVQVRKGCQLGSAISARYQLGDRVDRNDKGSAWGSAISGRYDTTTTGWAPGCQCGTIETRPCVVLDPFIGAGTTALVADRLQRDCIGVDLNVSYTEMAMERCRNDAPLFTSFPPAEPPEDERQKELFLEPEYGA